MFLELSLKKQKDEDTKHILFSLLFVYNSVIFVNSIYLNMKKVIFSLSLMAGVLTLSAQNLKTEMEKVSYSLGISVANSVKAQGLESVDPQAIGQAFSDVFEGNELAISEKRRTLFCKSIFRI